MTDSIVEPATTDPQRVVYLTPSHPDEQMVFTALGLVPRALLETRDIIVENPNDRSYACEWFLRCPGDPHNGELVRRDAFVNILKGQDLGVAQGIPNAPLIDEADQQNQGMSTDEQQPSGS